MGKLSEQAKKFMKLKPTYIGRRQGYKFYEHPIYGDESPLMMITPDGKLQKSVYWEMPHPDEFEESI